jgi:hypothetical protein
VSRVGRLAGALLVQTGGGWFLVGHLKRPCDFAAAGFAPPADGHGHPLERRGELAVPGPWLSVPLDGPPLLRELAERLLIERNGSVSERLWRLVLSPDPDAAPDPSAVVEARWLVELPAPLWGIVREAVLRCL